jgi:hypothetical protein
MDRITDGQMTHNPPVYRVYRADRGDLTERLREALRDYYARYGQLPGSVVVHPSLKEEAVEALAALDLPRLPVKGVGGCLVPEVWLAISGGDR